jgi:hypothetical protein
MHPSHTYQQQQAAKHKPAGVCLPVPASKQCPSANPSPLTISKRVVGAAGDAEQHGTAPRAFISFPLRPSRLQHLLLALGAACQLQTQTYAQGHVNWLQQLAKVTEPG